MNKQKIIIINCCQVKAMGDSELNFFSKPSWSLLCYITIIYISDNAKEMIKQSSFFLPEREKIRNLTKLYFFYN